MAEVELTAAALVDICKEHKLYRTPALNDTLYCSNRGFGALGPALEPYTGLKALYLDGNALRSLAGLPPLHDLKCL
jgi:dynein assembly factor 1